MARGEQENLGWRLACFLLLGLLIVCIVIIKLLYSANYKRSEFSIRSGQSATLLPDFEGAGRLTLVPITIAPPLDFIRAQTVVSEINDWHFKDMDLFATQEFLKNAGLDLEGVKKLIETASFDNETLTTIVPVTKDQLSQLAPPTREKIYIKLMDNHANKMQLAAFRYCGRDIDDWFSGSDISTELKGLVNRYIYRDGCYMFFSDLPLIINQIQSDILPKLLHVLYRQSTYLVKLNIWPDSDINRLVGYWGRGGRAKDVRSLLESLMRIDGGEKIDIVHILPPFSRRRLYTFPQPGTEAVAKGHRDCHWTAHNFFNIDPDDRFADPAEVAATLRNEYAEVEKPIYGDLVTYSRQNGLIFHTASYLASDLVYTKTGSKATWPWLITKIDDMAHFYPKSEPVIIRYFRQNAKQL